MNLRQSKYLNQVIEQEHRNIKRIVKPTMGFKVFNSMSRTLSRIEAMNMINEGQVKEIRLNRKLDEKVAQSFIS